MSKHHPMQPIEMAEDHVVRFKRNQIICDMQELCARHGLDLNEIAIRDYSKDDRSQLMQLIGYSVSGYGNLSCARAKHVMRADQKADGLGVSHNSAPQNDDAQNAARIEWDGEGLPPVGTVCEFQMALVGWVDVTITALTERSICFTRPAHNDKGTLVEELLPHGELQRFRPIRATDQIAADEIETILNWMVNRDSERGLRGIAEDLHADGYRKQVKP